MVLTIDIGNSNIILGVYQDERLLFVSRVRTSLRKTESEYAVLLKDILLLHGVQCQALRGGIISSVVPPLTQVLRAAVTIVHEIPGDGGGAWPAYGPEYPHRQSQAVGGGSGGYSRGRCGKISGADPDSGPADSHQNYCSGPQPQLSGEVPLCRE